MALTFWPNIYYDVIFALLTERLARRQGGLDAGQVFAVMLSIIDRFLEEEEEEEAIVSD